MTVAPNMKLLADGLSWNNVLHLCVVYGGLMVVCQSRHIRGTLELDRGLCPHEPCKRPSASQGTTQQHWTSLGVRQQRPTFITQRPFLVPQRQLWPRNQLQQLNLQYPSPPVQLAFPLQPQWQVRYQNQETPRMHSPVQYPVYYQQGQQSYQQVAHHSDRFSTEYTNPQITMQAAQQLLNRIGRLMDHVRPIDTPLPESRRFALFQLAAHFLSRLGSLSATLISHRRNSDMGKWVDDFLHTAEDKSYQLKTMLIGMQSFSNENEPVATPPKALQIQPPRFSPPAVPWRIGRNILKSEGKETVSGRGNVARVHNRRNR